MIHFRDVCDDQLNTHLAFPVYALFVLMDKVSGNEQRYHDDFTKMELRAPYRTYDASNELNLTELECCFWSAIRETIGSQIGIDAEHIHPSDKIEALIQMQFPLPDFMQIIFALERRLDAQLNANELSTLIASGDFDCLAKSVISQLELTEENTAREDNGLKSRSRAC